MKFLLLSPPPGFYPFRGAAALKAAGREDLALLTRFVDRAMLVVSDRPGDDSRPHFEGRIFPSGWD